MFALRGFEHLCSWFSIFYTDAYDASLHFSLLTTNYSLFGHTRQGHFFIAHYSLLTANYLNPTRRFAPRPLKNGTFFYLRANVVLARALPFSRGVRRSRVGLKSTNKNAEQGKNSSLRIPNCRDALRASDFQKNRNNVGTRRATSLLYVLKSMLYVLVLFYNYLNGSITAFNYINTTQ